MMERTWAQIRGLVLVLLLLALTVGAGQAQGAGSQGRVTTLAASMSTAFTYQGRLTDGGSPANGTYDFEFKLYDDPTSGSQVNGTVVTDDVTVTNGLFTVELDFGSNAFTGDARYLQIGVRPGSSTGAYTALTPRQALTATPYALSLRPGATINGNSTSNVLAVTNSYTSTGTVAFQAVVGSRSVWGPFSAGVWGDSQTKIGVFGSSTSNYGVSGISSTGIGVYGFGGGANPGVYGGADYGNGVSGWSETSYGVNGYSVTSYGVNGYSVDSAGGYFDSSTGHALVAEGPTLLGGRNPEQIALLRWYEANTTSISLAVADYPDQIAFDGAHIWVTNGWPGPKAGTVTKIRASDNTIIGVYSAGNNPNPIVFDGNCIWVGDEFNPNVTKLKASDGSTVASFGAGTTGHWGMAFDGANVWVSNSSSNSVTKIRASDNSILGTYTTGNGPQGMAFDGANIWVANSTDDTATKLLASNGALVGTYSTGPDPSGVAFDGANIWMTNRNPGVIKFRASDGAVLGNYTVGSNPYRLAFDGFHIWFTNYTSAGTITKLRAHDGVLVGTYATGSYPLGIAFDGANVWVADTYSHAVSKH